MVAYVPLGSTPKLTTEGFINPLQPKMEGFINSKLLHEIGKNRDPPGPVLEKKNQEVSTRPLGIFFSKLPQNQLQTKFKVPMKL